MNLSPDARNNNARSSPIEQTAVDDSVAIVVIDQGQRTAVHLTQIVDWFHTRDSQEFQSTIGNADVVVILNLLRWSDEERWAILRFVSSIGGSPTIKTAEDGPDFNNLFDAVLHLLEPDADPDLHHRWRRAAVEAAGIAHPDAEDLEAACRRLVARVRELGIRGVRTSEVLAEAETAARAAHPRRVHLGRALDSIFPDAGFGNLVVPRGWRVDCDGVRRTAGGNRKAESATISAPIVLTKRLATLRIGVEFLKLSWLRDGQWQHRIVERATIATARKIVELAAYGVPVTSNNAATLVEFLAAFESENLPALPSELVVDRMGWIDGLNRCGFFSGENLLVVANGSNLAVNLQPADAGQAQIVSAFRPQGTMETWQRAIRDVTGFPEVMLDLCTSLCTPLLYILDAHNFVVSYAGPTSRGKTTTLRIAASCWGCPDERSSSSTLGTWDASRTCIERTTTLQGDHPLLLDDTKRARDSHDIAQTLYDISTGRGRGRGTIGSIAETGSFRTVLISSGESPITSFSRDGGTRARVLELWGSPFGRTDATTARIATTANQSVLDNYGHAGPAFVRFLLANQAVWDSWREEFRGCRAEYLERAGDDPVAARLAEHAAVLEMAARLAADAEILPHESRGVVSQLWPRLAAETAEADQAEAALRIVWEWALRHRETFIEQPRQGQFEPTAGWSGRWGQEYVGVFPAKAERILRDAGFEPDAMLRIWADRSWLRVSPNRRYYRCRIGGCATDLVAIRRRTIDELFAGAEEDEGPPALGRTWPS